MKNKIATAFEQIEKKSRIDVLMSKVNTTLVASHQADCFAQCEWLLNKCIDEMFDQISICSSDETAE